MLTSMSNVIVRGVKTLKDGTETSYITIPAHKVNLLSSVLKESLQNDIINETAVVDDLLIRLSNAKPNNKTINFTLTPIGIKELDLLLYEILKTNKYMHNKFLITLQKRLNAFLLKYLNT